MILHSNEFITLKACKQETKYLKDSIYKKLGVDKNKVSLGRGNIILCGFDKDNKAWLQLTDSITSFKRWLQSPQYSSYKLITTDIQLQH